MKNRSVPISEGPQGLPGGFWLAIVAGLALRVWYFVDLRAQPWFGYPLVDAQTFERTALGILAGRPEGVFTRPPLYSHFLAALYAVAGHHASAVVAAQVALGLATLLPAYVLGRRWFGAGVALAGVWVAACYPLRIFFEGETLDVTLFSFLFVVATWTLWRALEGASAAGVALAGLFYGFAALARPNVLLALPLIGLGAVRALRIAPRRAVAWGAAGAAGVVIALSPAAAHNWRAGGGLVAVGGNGGVNFYLGNARGASGTTPVPPGLRWEQVMARPIREGRVAVQEQDRWWYRQALAQIRADPLSWTALLAKKAAIFAGAPEPGNNKALSRFTAVSFPVRHYRLWYGLLACAALVGLAARPGAGTTFLRWLVAGFACSVVLFFVAERYRLPLVPLLAPAAAAGVAEVARAVRRRAFGRGAALAALALAAAVALLPDWFGAGVERIDADHQMAQVRLMRGEPQLALAALQRAGRADPRDPDVWNARGAALFRLGDLDGAEGAYRAALELGDFAEVWFNLGVIAERRGPGGRAAAAAAYRRAIEINPADPRPRANLAGLAEQDVAPPAGAGAAR